MNAFYLFTGYLWVEYMLENSLSVSENRVLSRMFESKREAVTGGCRRLRNEQVHNFHSLPIIVRLIK